MKKNIFCSAKNAFEYWLDFCQRDRYEHDDPQGSKSNVSFLAMGGAELEGTKVSSY